MNVTVVGTGYVGLVAGTCFAENGNDVICVDIDEAKIEGLKKGQIPIYEPGLDDMVSRNLRNGRLKFTTSMKEGVVSSEIIFIAVGTPESEDGSSDLKYVLKVAEDIGKYMNGPKTIVDKSTVPVATANLVRETIASFARHEFDVVSNPEFLKEGAAIDDFLKPDRIVVGVDNERAGEVMKDLYAPFVRTNKPILLMDILSAETTKYAANAMLATRISFMNEIANLCEKTGADIDAVRRGIGSDSRIGSSFLFPGPGYGGSCFPKDIHALINIGKHYGVELKIISAVTAVNGEQKKVLARKIVRHYESDHLEGRVFAVWGLAFKPNTDDVREAPSLVVCGDLIRMGAHVQAFDPEAMPNFRRQFGESEKLRYVESDYGALENADALVICTEWNEFRHPNFEKMRKLMKTPLIFDGRNLYDPKVLKKYGFRYCCIGRPTA